MTSAVVAIGGNAILRKGEAATAENQLNNLRRTCAPIARMVRQGYAVTLVHGNGPQVGGILLQNELAKAEVPPMPLDVCVAESQGQIGLMLQQAMTDALRREGVDRTVVCLLTRVIVDPGDPAFARPAKPIGPYYGREEAERLGARGWTMAEDPGRGGWRRVVPSPRPLNVVEGAAARSLAAGGHVVIAAGGGGVPVMRCGDRLCGIEAVVDKDLAALALARCVGSELLIMLTDVDAAYRDFGTERQQAIGEATAAEMQRYLAEGHFPAGSMGPKVEAAVGFAAGGRTAIITAPELLDKALESKAGTRVVA